MTTLPLDHVGVAVRSIDSAAPHFERITGVVRSAVEALPQQGVKVCFVGALELLEPTSPSSPVARFLDRRGPALHHVAYRCDDVRAELERLRGEGYVSVDDEPRRGARGHLVAFLHPQSTGKVLVELVQLDGPRRVTPKG